MSEFVPDDFIQGWWIPWINQDGSRSQVVRGANGPLLHNEDGSIEPMPTMEEIVRDIRKHLRELGSVPSRAPRLVVVNPELIPDRWEWTADGDPHCRAKIVLMNGFPVEGCFAANPDRVFIYEPFDGIYGDEVKARVIMGDITVRPMTEDELRARKRRASGKA